MSEALSAQVVETQITHVYDVIFYRDGSTRHLGDNKAAVVTQSININLLNMSRKFQLTHKPGTLVFSQKQNTHIIPGTITEAQKIRPEMAEQTINMALTPVQGKYNPRLASVTVGNIDTQKIIWLYPGLKYSHGHAKALYGQISFAGNTPASWALLELKVDYKPQKSITLYAQADQNGEFDMPLTGLPSRPKNINHYHAELTIKSQAENQTDSQSLADPDSFTNSEVGLSSVDNVVTYGDSMSIDLKPELRTRIVTNGAERLIINHLNN